MTYASLTNADLRRAADAAVATLATEPVGTFAGQSGYMLMSVEADAKTVKGTKRGFLTGVVYLLASSESGVLNVCPHSDQCEAPCLVRAGRASFDPSILRARLRRTLLFKADRALYMEMNYRDTARLAREAAKRELSPVKRENGTSDLPIERFPVRGFANIMEAFPEVTFYDYTKWPLRLRGVKGKLPANYSLTFSLAVNNDRPAREALDAGINVAAVFDTRKGKALPDAYVIGGMSYPVVDGDESDLRFLDRPGVIVGLRAKGPAIGDTSGFVRSAASDTHNFSIPA